MLRVHFCTCMPVNSTHAFNFHQGICQQVQALDRLQEQDTDTQGSPILSKQDSVAVSTLLSFLMLESHINSFAVQNHEMFYTFWLF